MTNYEKFCDKITASVGVFSNYPKRSLHVLMITTDVTQSTNHDVGRMARWDRHYNIRNAAPECCYLTSQASALL